MGQAGTNVLVHRFVSSLIPDLSKITIMIKSMKQGSYFVQALISNREEGYE